jgi:hypothetical protein
MNLCDGPVPCPRSHSTYQKDSHLQNNKFWNEKQIRTQTVKNTISYFSKESCCITSSSSVWMRRFIATFKVYTLSCLDRLVWGEEVHLTKLRLCNVGGRSITYSMEHWCENQLKCSGRNLSHYYPVHQKFRLERPRMEPKPLRCQFRDQSPEPWHGFLSF